MRAPTPVEFVIASGGMTEADSLVLGHCRSGCHARVLLLNGRGEAFACAQMSSAEVTQLIADLGHALRFMHEAEAQQEHGVVGHA